MRQPYIFPFILATSIHGALFYAYTTDMEPPNIYIAQSPTALELCFQGTECIQTVHAPNKNEAQEEVNPIAETSNMMEDDSASIGNIVTHNKPDAEKTTKEKMVTNQKADPCPSAHEHTTALGNSTISHQAAAGSVNGFTAPHLIYNPTPVYPRHARRREEEGMVIVSITITSKGDVKQASILQSSTFPLLDQAAMDAILKWKFQPATQDGNAIDFQHTIPFVFKLK